MNGCENCRQTERNLAAAYVKITQLIDAERDLSLAENYARELNQTLIDRRAHLRNSRIEIATWLEEQR